MGVFREKRCFVGGLRGAAAILLTASLLCALAGQAMAAVTEALPSATTTNLPAVTVEGNAVVDSNGQPTGFFELALKVRTKFYFDAANQPVTDPATADPSRTLEHPFRSAAVALRYDAELLTPVTWSYTLENPTVGEIDESTATGKAPVALDTKKPDNGITASAAVEGYNPGDANNFDRPTALLTLSAKAPGSVVSYDTETIVCVVRFKYDPTKLNMDAKGTYPFLRPAAAPEGQDLDNKQACVVWFAEDAEAAKSAAGQSAWYQGAKDMTDAAKTYFYYYLNAPTLKVDGTPDTAGSRTFIDSAVMPGTKDYTANILDLNKAHTPGGLAFQLVNTTSYANGGVNVDNLATILFYDWDDTLINVLTVEKGDARAAVNAHIEKTMIHPELQASGLADATKKEGAMNGLDRKYTYRGTYPAEGPTGSTTVTDGDKYVLTNKLDYAFYRRPTKLVEKDPANPADPTITHWEVDNNDSTSDEAYPYVNGWAVVADIKNIENVWTTFGVGELKDINPADPSKQYITNGTAANYFKLEDFSNLTPGIHYVKACFEEGTILNKSDNYSLIGDVGYSRYSNVASTIEGSSYSIKYEYGRISESGFGVGRTRDPSVKLYYITDKEGTSDQKFFLEVAVKNNDVVQVEFMPTGTFLNMQYSLVEKYGAANFIEGIDRTMYGNILGISANYDYDNGWSYDNRLGSDGFVYIGTINQIMEYGTKAVKTGDSSTFTNLLTYQTFQDLNLRRDASGTEITTVGNASSTATKVLDAIDKVLQYGGPGMLDKNGNVVLDWHQLQYHIIHYDTGGIYNGSGIMSKADCTAADGGYLWCHQDECGGGSGAIASLTDLLKAAYKVYDGSFPNALDQLNINLLNNLFLRADMKGNVYQSNLASFKAALNSAIGKLTTDGPYNAATIGTVTWKELQYALIFDAYKKDSNITENFWWQNGQAPTVGSFADLVDLAFKAYVDGYHPDVIKNVSMTAVNKYYLRADKDGGKFADVTAFLNAVKTTVQALSADGGYTAATIKDVDWIEVQHLLIPGNTYRAKTDLRGDATIDYWWESGGSPSIKTVGDLMKAAYGVFINGDDPNNISGATVAKMKEFFLRANADGAAFASAGAIQTALESAVKALTAPSGPYDNTNIDTATWKEIQYALIHGTYQVDASITEDYWWWNDGSPTISTLADLLKYGYKAHVGGGNKNELLKNATLTVADGLYLRRDLSGSKFITQATFDAAYKQAILALTTSPGPYTQADIESATWKEFQYALIHGSYQADADITDDLWWEGGASKVISTLPDLLTAAYFVYGDGSDLTALDSITDATVANFGQAPFWLRSEAENGTPFATAAEFKAALQHIIVSAKPNGYTAATIGSLAWIQVQYMALDDDGDGVKNGFKAMGAITGTNYWWLNGGTKPTGTPVENVMGEILTLASQLNPNYIGELSDNTLLTALIDNYVAGIKLKDSSGFLGTADLQVAIETMVNTIYEQIYDYGDSAYEPYLDADGMYVQMTWQEVQHYLLGNGFAEEGTFTGYDWKPTLVASADAAAVFEIMSQMEAAMGQAPAPPSQGDTAPPETPPVEDAEKEPSAPLAEDTVPIPPESNVGGGVPDAPNTPVPPEVPETVQPPADDTAVPPTEAVEEEPLAPPQDNTAAPPAEVVPVDAVARGLAPAAFPIASPDAPPVAAHEHFFISAYQPAALPPPPPRITLYRRTLRRKLISRTAIRGGINL